MQRLKEFYPLSRKQIISESKKNGTMTLEGLFQRAETPNRNKRVYPKALLEREINKLQPLIEGNRLVGELDHPDRLNMNYTNSSHKITKLYMEGNDVFGQIQLLNTPQGKVAQQLIKDGVVLGISSRGAGSLEEINEINSPYGDAKWIVNEDFSMVTFDIVPDESTVGSTMSLIESVQAVKDIETSKANKVFIQLLKQSLVHERHGVKRGKRIFKAAGKLSDKALELPVETSKEVLDTAFNKAKKAGGDSTKASRTSIFRSKRSSSKDKEIQEAISELMSIAVRETQQKK